MSGNSILYFIPIVSILSTAAVIVIVFFLVLRSREKRTESIVSIQTSLLDKFGSAPELVQFLRSPEGRGFLGAAAVRRGRQLDRILSSIKIGAVLSCGGIGFIFLSVVFVSEMIVPGVLLLSLGLGFLLSAAISMKMSRKWGMLDRDDLPGQLDQVA